MTERVLRCPYCVVGDEFMPMIALADGAFLAKCGHLEIPGNEDLKCHCSRCVEFRARSFRAAAEIYSPAPPPLSVKR